MCEDAIGADVPILLLIFNRLETTELVLGSIATARPKRLYIASDGPRNGKEKYLVDSVRARVMQMVDWDCQIFTLFREDNLGCKRAVHEAIQWFFAKEEKGIVLEDDVLPSKYFYNYCAGMLEVYKDFENVGSIAGRNELGDFASANSDYFGSSKFFCWGWASWSDRILGISVDTDYSEVLSCTSMGFREKLLVKGMLGLISAGGVNSWAFPYDLNFRKRGRICIVPQKNMIKNIGLNTVGAHSNGTQEDQVDVFSSFNPAISKTAELNADSKFIAAFTKKRFRNLLHLFLFSNSRYLVWIKKAIRRGV